MAELKCGGSHTASGPVEQQGLSRSQPALQMEGVEGGQEDLGDARRLLKTQTVRYGQRQAFRSDHLLRVARTRQQSHDSLSRLEFGDCGAGRFHGTGELEPGYPEIDAGRRRIEPLPLEQVGPIQGGGADPDQDFSG